ncbi:MAG: hypothetical protein O3B86_04705, partial [Planctomycetota bacterium]|nr:hypothetical protein [Planctomycetota bacterium]
MRGFQPAVAAMFQRTSAGIIVTGVALSFAVQPAQEASAQSRFSGTLLSRSASQDTPPESATSSQSETASTTRLNFYSKSWDQVLKHVAESTGSDLVADRMPRGRYSRQDFKSHSRSEAVRLLNSELEKQDFRILEKGRYLVLLHLPSARPEYARLQIDSPDLTRADSAQVQDSPNPPASAAPRSSQTAPASPTLFAQQQPQRSSSQYTPPPRQRSFERSSVTIQPSALADNRDAAPADEPRTQRSRPGAIRQLGYDGASDAAEPATPKVPQKLVRELFQPRSRTARSLSATLYGAFRERAEIVEDGPDGLPAMRVYGVSPAGAADQPRTIVFT